MPSDEEPQGEHADQREQVLRLFLQHHAMLSGFLFTMCEDWELVEEAVQETAVFVCRRWSDYTPGTNFSAWVRAVARLRCHEAIRRRPHPGEDGDLLADEVSEAEWSSAAATVAERKEALLRCLDALPQRDRTIVDQRYLQERSSEDIARAMGSTVDALYMALSRVRRRLRACVKRRLAGTVEPS
jgi:RNA polymerase sigma-70 factor (ECF subfamily)